MEPMIVVTRLNDSRFAINPDLIERIHSNPDTTLVMVDGAKYIVTESMDEVVERIAAYRARVISLAYDPQPQRGSSRPFGLVSATDDESPGNESGDTGNTVPLRPRRK
jgi:flagellar protein FlbD